MCKFCEVRPYSEYAENSLRAIESRGYENNNLEFCLDETGTLHFFSDEGWAAVQINYCPVCGNSLDSDKFKRYITPDEVLDLLEKF